MRIAASVAAHKEKYPERYCAAPGCLWRAPKGHAHPFRCPRHPAPENGSERRVAGLCYCPDPDPPHMLLATPEEIEAHHGEEGEWVELD